MMKKALALFLSFLMLMAALVSCGSDEKDEEIAELKEMLEQLIEEKEKENTINASKETGKDIVTNALTTEITTVVTSDTTAVTTVQTTAATEAPVAEPEYPDYGGRTFNILSAGNTAYNDFDCEYNGYTSLEIAQYDRVATVEQIYNVDIVEEIKQGYSSATSGKPGAGYSAINSQVASGTVNYDLCLIAGYDVAQLASQGYLYDMNSIPGIDLTQSYWDQNAVRDLSSKGVTFFTTGDITLSDENAASCILFNKKLADDYNIDPYELVKSGEWTIEKLTELSKKVSEDLNQDGVYDENDRYGLLVWDDSVLGMVNAAGQRVASFKENGEIELTFYNEMTLDALYKYAEIAYDTEHALQYQRYNNSGPADKFWNGNLGLFLTTSISNVEKYSEEVEFGFLPYPKAYVTQENYYTHISPFSSQFVCVPLIVEDIECVGTVTEALAYYGEKLVTPKFYDLLLSNGSYDDTEILELIFDNFIYDIGYYYQIGSYNKQLILRLREKKSDWSVMYDTQRPSADVTIKSINSAYKQAVDLWIPNT